MNDITCIATIPDVIEAFNRTKTPEVAIFYLTLTYVETYNVIPDNFISNKQMSIFNFLSDPNYSLKIAKDAFNSTKNYTSRIELSKLYLEDSNLSFLEGFTKVSSLLLLSLPDMEKVLPTFPRNLPMMSALSFDSCLGWNSMSNNLLPMVNAGELIRLDIIRSVDLTDNAMDDVMEWVITSFHSSLRSLYIYSNNLTRIPLQIEFFDRLNLFSMKNNLFPQIPAGSIKFKSNDMREIDISSCGVRTIEPGAFEGIR